MRGLEPAQQVLHVSVPVLVALAERRVPNQPGVRNKFNYAVNNVWCNPPGHLSRLPLGERWQTGGGRGL